MTSTVHANEIELTAIKPFPYVPRNIPVDGSESSTDTTKFPLFNNVL